MCQNFTNMCQLSPTGFSILTFNLNQLASSSESYKDLVQYHLNRPANQYNLVVFSTIFRSKYDSTIFLNKIRFSSTKKKKNFVDFFDFFKNQYFVCASAIFNGKMSILSCKVSYKHLTSAIWGCSLVHRTHQS